MDERARRADLRVPGGDRGRPVGETTQQEEDQPAGAVPEEEVEEADGAEDGGAGGHAWQDFWHCRNSLTLACVCTFLSYMGRLREESWGKNKFATAKKGKERRERPRLSCTVVVGLTLIPRPPSLSLLSPSASCKLARFLLV